MRRLIDAANEYFCGTRIAQVASYKRNWLFLKSSNYLMLHILWYVASGATFLLIVLSILAFCTVCSVQRSALQKVSTCSVRLVTLHLVTFRDNLVCCALFVAANATSSVRLILFYRLFVAANDQFLCSVIPFNKCNLHLYAILISCNLYF